MPLIPPSLAIRAGSFFAKPIVKVIGVALLLAALAFLVWKTVDAVKDWQTDTYNSGFRAGSDMQEARWQKANARNAQAQRDQLLADIRAQNKAVTDYLADAAAREPLVVKVKEEVTRYAQSPAGSMQCLDDDGVRLIFQGREASGIVGQTGPATGTPSPIRGPMRSEPPAPPVQPVGGRETLHDEGSGNRQSERSGRGGSGVSAATKRLGRLVAPERHTAGPRLT